MDFHGLLDTLRNPPEEGLPEDIYDNLQGAYDAVSENFDNATAKIDSLVKENDGLNSTISGLNDTVSGLKSKAYDLMTRVGVADDDKQEDSEPEGGRGIADFFNQESE